MSAGSARSLFPPSVLPLATVAVCGRPLRDWLLSLAAPVSAFAASVVAMGVTRVILLVPRIERVTLLHSRPDGRRALADPNPRK